MHAVHTINIIIYIFNIIINKKYYYINIIKLYNTNINLKHFFLY